MSLVMQLFTKEANDLEMIFMWHQIALNVYLMDHFWPWWLRAQARPCSRGVCEVCSTTGQLQWNTYILSIPQDKHSITIVTKIIETVGIAYHPPLPPPFWWSIFMINYSLYWQQWILVNCLPTLDEDQNTKISTTEVVTSSKIWVGSESYVTCAKIKRFTTF